MLYAGAAKLKLLHSDERFTRLPWEMWLLPQVKAYLGERGGGEASRVAEGPDDLPHHCCLLIPIRSPNDV